MGARIAAIKLFQFDLDKL